MTANAHQQHAAGPMMEAVAEAREEVGFRVSDRRTMEDVFKVIGYEITSSPTEVRLPRKRVAALYDETTDLLRPRRVLFAHLSHAMGVWVWGAILRRPLRSRTFSSSR